MKDYYVYIHRRAHDKAVFYVGKGCGYRAWSNLRSEFWKRTVAKYGYEVEIVISGLQEWAAFEFEQSLIAYYGRRNPRARRVRCVDTGEVFDCLRDASRWLHSVGKRGCVTSVVNGKNDTAGGYHWAYADN